MFSFKNFISLCAVISLGCFNFSYASSDEYNTRNMVDTREQSFSNLPQGNDLVFSFAMVSKGASGFRNGLYFSYLSTVLEKAKKEDQLTNDGKAFLAAVSELKQFIRTTSSSRLTERGITQLNDLGANYAKNRKELLLKKIYENEIPVLFSYNGDKLALDSGEKFVIGMTKSLPEDAQIIYMQDDDVTQNYIEKILSFYDNSEYVRYLTSYPALVGAIGKHLVAKQSVIYNEALINRVFKKEFAESFIHMGVMPDRTIMSKIEVASFVKYIYELYTFLPCLNESFAKKYQNIFDIVMPEKERKYWSTLEDASLFYRYGPGFKSQPISNQAAQNIFSIYEETLNDFDQDNIEETVKLIFVDYKAMLSFISLIKGDEVGKPLDATEEFSFYDNKFKAAQLAPYASILIWDIYRNRTGEYFVKMKFNGRDALFKSSCGNDSQGLYSWKQLQLCLKELY